jgi:hypothetical protein
MHNSIGRVLSDFPAGLLGNWFAWGTMIFETAVPKLPAEQPVLFGRLRPRNLGRWQCQMTHHLPKVPLPATAKRRPRSSRRATRCSLQSQRFGDQTVRLSPKSCLSDRSATVLGWRPQTQQGRLQRDGPRLFRSAALLLHLFHEARRTRKNDEVTRRCLFHEGATVVRRYQTFGHDLADAEAALVGVCETGDATVREHLEPLRLRRIDHERPDSIFVRTHSRMLCMAFDGVAGHSSEHKNMLIF